MKKILVLLLSGGLLAACSSTDIAKNIEAVQKATLSACAYLPTATVIAAIFSKNQDKLKSVTDVASAICTAATVKAVAGVPEVAGVPLEGVFVEIKK